MTDLDRPSDPEADLEIDNAALRRQYLNQQKTLTSSQIREASGLKTRNPSEPASRWKRQGKIFGVPVGRTDHYPAFQFADGRPRPVIAKVLAALPEAMSPWQIAFWFASANGWIETDAVAATYPVSRPLSSRTAVAYQSFTPAGHSRSRPTNRSFTPSARARKF